MNDDLAVLTALLSEEEAALEPGQIGRQPTYTPAVGSAILRRMLGGETLLAICKDDAMPDLPTLSAWRMKYPSLDEAIDRVRVIQASYRADEAYEAVHSAVDKDSAYVARVQADTYLRLAARQDPGRFAERRDSGPAVSVTITTDVQGPTARGNVAGEYRIELLDGELEENPKDINDLF